MRQHPGFPQSRTGTIISIIKARMPGAILRRSEAIPIFKKRDKSKFLLHPPFDNQINYVERGFITAIQSEGYYPVSINESGFEQI